MFELIPYITAPLEYALETQLDERARKNGRTPQEEFCAESKALGNPPRVNTPLGIIPNPCIANKSGGGRTDLMTDATDVYHLGRKAQEQREFEKAENLFRQSIELRPHFKTMERLGEMLLESHGASGETVVLLAAAAGLGGRQPRPLLLLGKALAIRGEVEDAIATLDRAIEIQPTYKKAVELRDELKARLPISEPTDMP